MTTMANGTRRAVALNTNLFRVDHRILVRAVVERDEVEQVILLVSKRRCIKIGCLRFAFQAFGASLLFRHFARSEQARLYLDFCFYKEKTQKYNNKEKSSVNKSSSKLSNIITLRTKSNNFVFSFVYKI